MDFETASKCCATACSGSTHGSSSVIREGNTPSAGQATKIDLPATCLRGRVHEHEDEEANMVKYNMIDPEGGKCGFVDWGQLKRPGEEEACNNSEKSDRSGSSSIESMAYTVRETHKVGRAEELTEGTARSQFAGASRDSPGTACATKMVHARTPTEDSKAPDQPPTCIASAESVATGDSAGRETEGSAAISSSIVWTEFLNLSIPANVRAYEEFFRRCVSPAASASPTSTGNTGSPTGPRKSSAGTDQGNPSLSRFETLSTQPSNPRLYADDVADDSSPMLVAAALVPSAPTGGQEDEHHHSRVCVGEEGHSGELGIAALGIKTEEAVGRPGQHQAEEVAAGVAAGKDEVLKCERAREGSRGSSRISDTTDLAGGALVPNADERAGCSLHGVNRSTQDSAACGEGNVLSPLQSPFEAATAPANGDTERAGQCSFMTQVASGASCEKSEVRGIVEERACTSVDGGYEERSNAGTSAACVPPAVIKGTSRILSPSSQTTVAAVQLDSTTEGGDDSSACSTACVAPATTASEEPAAQVATDETGGDRHAAQAEGRAAYARASDLTASRCNADEQAVIGCDTVGAPSVRETPPDGTAASVTDGTCAVPVISRGTVASGDSRAPRGGVLAGEGPAAAGPRGRPSLGAAGRQLLLDHIRAKYHTNVGLYSGVLRKNYNSTISKLPFFTVSLLHQLAADFGIDTNAVLEQQQQQHCDSTRGSNSRHNTETGYSTGARGARQGAFVGAAHARGAGGSGGAFYLRNTAADRRTLTGGSQGVSAYGTTTDKRKGRLHYESSTRRRCTRLTTKKNGSTSDGAVGSLPGERGESICPPRGVRRRSVGMRTSRTSWEPEAVDSTPTHTQGENLYERGSMRTQGGIDSPEQDTRRQQRKSGKGHEQGSFDEYAGDRVVSRMKEEAASEGKAWTEDQALRAEISSISTASGTVVRARAVAIGKRREELGQQSSIAHDDPHCGSRSTSTAAIELLGSSIERGQGDTLNQGKWRTVADVRLLVREQGRDQRRVLSALSNMEEDEENDGRKSVGDVCVRSRSLEGMSLSTKNEHSKWLGGATPGNRLAPADSYREHQQHDAVETYAGALAYVRRPPGDANVSWWTRDGRVNDVAAVGAAEEKRRNNCPSHAPFASGASGGAICGPTGGDGGTLRTQTMLKENASVCQLPHARYLWSVLFGQLPEESARALHSAVAGQDLSRTPAGGEKCEETGGEFRAGSEKCFPHSNAADMSQPVTLMSTDRRETHASTDLSLAMPQPDKVLAAVSTAVGGAGVRVVGEGVSLCRGREWASRIGPANNECSYGQSATEGTGTFAAVSGSETGVVAARVSDVERLLDVDAREADTGHMRKRLKTEAIWSQSESEVHKSRSVMQMQPHCAPSSHGTRNYLPFGGHQESSGLRGDRRALADDRILELLNRRGEEAPEGVGGGTRGTETRDVANACFLQKTSTPTFKRGTADGQSLGDRIDCKSFTITTNASEDLFSGSRIRDPERIQSCTEEPEAGWRESMHMQQRSPFDVRTRNQCSSDREASTQTEGRSIGRGCLRVPFSPLTGDQDACQRFQNGLNSPPVALQEQCRGKVSPASASGKQPIPSTGGSGEHNGTLEGYPGSPKYARKRPLVEPWWPEPVGLKVAQDRPSPPTLDEVPLTAPCTSGISSSCRTPSPLIGCTVGRSVPALEVKQHPPELQHERHPMLVYNRNKVTPLGGAKGRMHVALETSGGEPSSRGWLPREAAEADARKVPQPPYGKGTDPDIPDAATGFKNAARDTWCVSPPVSQNTALGDTPSETMPLASLLLSSLLPEETAKPSGLNASASVGSRYTSRVVALLQTLSELQRKPASVPLPPQAPQQQNNDVGEGPVGEGRHSFPSPSSTSATPHPREKSSPVQRLPNLNVPGILSTLLRALLQKADDRCGDAGVVGTRQRTETCVQEQVFQHVQQRKQEVVDASGGHSGWLNAKGGNDWTTGTQEAAGPHGISCYGLGETSTSSCLRRTEPTDTPLALELVENFLKAQGLSGTCSSYPSERRRSLIYTSQGGGCGRHGDRSGRQVSVVVDSQGTAETSIPRKGSGKNSLGGTGNASGADDPRVVSYADDVRVHSVKDEHGKRHEFCEVQSPYARYSTLHGS